MKSNASAITVSGVSPARQRNAFSEHCPISMPHTASLLAMTRILSLHSGRKVVAWIWRSSMFSGQTTLGRIVADEEK
jgi:hypothetical protein